MSDETMSDVQQNELLFMQLVMMFQGMAMQQLGKVMNPMTQKVERDLGQAKNFIDLLSMIEKKKRILGEDETGAAYMKTVDESLGTLKAVDWSMASRLLELEESRKREEISRTPDNVIADMFSCSNYNGNEQEL